MKKIIAAALCITIASPCFAAGRYHNYYPKQHNRTAYYHHENRYDYHSDGHRYKYYNRTSQRTRTLATVTGIAGVAMLISAIVD